MHKLLSAIAKETRFLIRDLPGLAILFLMPLALVLVVTLAQEHAVNRNRKTPLTVQDKSESPLSKRIMRDIDSSGMFEIRRLETHHTIRHPASCILRLEDTAITLVFDPTLSPAEQKSLQSTLTFLIRGSEAKQVMENTLDLMFIGSDTTMKTVVRATLEKGLKEMPPVRPVYDLPDQSEIKPSVIQNSVPGFILFAMFFIVIPLSASIIAEKNEGAHTRLMTLPVSRTILYASKGIVYLVVCLLQFLLMTAMGAWLFPLVFGLEPLHIGSRWGLMILVTAASSLAAIGFGFLTGTLARTIGQAALFGSVMVVILGLISGTFLPIHLMPAAIQYISLASPVRWGIESYLVVLIRGGGIADILIWLILLLLFFFLAMMISIYIFARRK